MPGRSFFLSAVSLVIGLGVALLLGEILVRIAGAGSPLTYLPNPLYGWSHTPNDVFARTTGDHSVDIQINSLGLRDVEYSYAKAPGRHRTLVLGDSFAEALQVPIAAAFPKLIEKRLNSAQRDDGNAFEVLNAGTSGYGTDNELLFMRHEGYKYDPDVVLLALYIGNDVRNNWYPLENIDTGGFRKPYFTPGDTSLELNAFPFNAHSTLTSRMKVFFNRNVRLYSLLRETRDRLRNRGTIDHDGGTKSGEGIPLDSYLFQSEYTPEWETAWRVTEDLILELQTEAQKHNAELFVALIPAQFQVHEAYWRERLERYAATPGITWDLTKPNRILNAFLDENDIAHIDLLPEFRHRAATVDHEYYLVHDSHWNEAGHELAAELITEELTRAVMSP